jgi:zinc transport system ATP-binding protein
MSLIKCEHISLGYDGKIVLDDVNLTIEEGDYLSIVGENGSGKSTFVKALLGLIKPIKGSITFSKSLKKNAIGYLPQTKKISHNFPASVEEVILSGFLNRKTFLPFYNKEEKEIAANYMEILDITSLQKKSFQELSIGQMQRVLLARALCATQKLLILDEPVAGMDPVASAEFYAIMKMLNEQYHITIIMISHDIVEAVKQSQKILHLHGKTLFYGYVSDYIETKIAEKFLKGVIQ